MTSTQTLWAPGQKLQQLPFIQLPVPATARPQLLSRPQSHQYFSSPAWSVQPSRREHAVPVSSKVQVPPNIAASTPFGEVLGEAT